MSAKQAIQILNKYVGPSRERLLQLQKKQCEIFQTTFNPTGARTGSKILNLRLKGPSVLNYYGTPDFPKFSDLNRIAKTHYEMELIDEDEEFRLEMLLSRRKRGKGAPKKLREKKADDGKKKKKK